MRKSTAVLGALLAVSAALNAMLLARGRAEPPRDVQPRPRPAPATAARTVPKDVEPLGAGPRQVEALEARIRQLETDKKILVDTPSPAGPDRIGLLREKLRRANEIFSKADPERFNDPSLMLEFSETFLEVGRISLARSKDPKTYASMLRALYETLLDDPDAPLGDDQKAVVARAFDDLGPALAGIRADSAAERLVRELEAEAATVDAVRGALDEKRRDQLNTNPLMSSIGGSMLNTIHLQDKNREEQIVSAWAQAYGLDAAQKDAAKPAARALAVELALLGGKMERPEDAERFQGGTPAQYRFRTATLQAQIQALRQIEGSLTSEQRERLRTQLPREFLVYPTGTFGVAPEEPEKK